MKEIINFILKWGMLLGFIVDGSFTKMKRKIK